MSEGHWKRGWKEWWFAGRAWFVRALGMSGFGAAIWYLLGPRVLVHYPPWVGGLVAGGGAALIWGALTLVISLLKASGKIIRERDETIESKNARIRELEATRPRLSGCLHEQGGRLYLRVHNEGAPAEVWAKITAIGDITKSLDNVDAVWKDEAGADVTIGTGGHNEIVIAGMGTSGSHEQITPGEIVTDLIHSTGALFYWFVPYISGGQRDSARSNQGAVPSVPGIWDASQDEEANAIRQRLTIRVYSDPTSLSPPIVCEITLFGCDQYENLSGVPLCPSSPPSPSEPSDKWQDFQIAANHLLAMFRGVRDSSQSLLQDWRVFQGAVREALSLSDLLDVTLKEQAQALIRPFDGVEQSALDSLSDAAAELQDWLITTNRHILGQRWKSPVVGPSSSTPSG